MLRIAHRGASGHEPENTLAALANALATKPDMLEVDVRLSKDRQVIAMHDAKVDRTTNGKGKVKTLTLKELKNLDAGNGEKIPTLEEILDFVKNRAKINIDLKEKDVIDPMLSVIEIYVKDKKYSYKDFLISAFRPDILKAVQHRNKNIPLALNFAFFPKIFLFLSRTFNLQYIKPHRHVISKNIISIAHEKGWKVLVWTINKPKDIEKMKELGVDGILTDFPDRI